MCQQQGAPDTLANHERGGHSLNSLRQTCTRPGARRCDPAAHTYLFLDEEGVGLMSCFAQRNKNPADKQTKENEQMLGNDKKMSALSGWRRLCLGCHRGRSGPLAQQSGVVLSWQKGRAGSPPASRAGGHLC